MTSLMVVVIGLVAACSASPSLYFSGPQYYSGYYPTAVVSPIKSQYHTQNELGQYAYGYNDGYSSKSETKHANGLTEGSYSYVDPNGVLQQYKYLSDENGYRVTGTNLPVAPAVPAVEAPAAAPAAAVEIKPASDAELPQQVQDTPEVAAAKAAHQIAYDEAAKAAEASPEEPSSEAVAVEAPAAEPVAKAETPAPAPAAVHVSAPAYSYHPTAYGTYPSYAIHAPVASYAYAAAPAAYAYAPYAAAVPSYTGAYSPVNSQYHSQDEFGQYSYGYNSGSSSKAEVKTIDGVTRGGYSYVDANGLVQQYHYVSDPVNGFRVTGTNLPANTL
ncbi:Insect cuticle protein [Cinara cedri]|uniref:Insect cuticle protein n=1 Tax=Cinara cedri TaxID=506608 RepID=A0A5E4N295_9HEMI|nr:Insect cuticle protein [Cinara cedri]